MGKWLHVYSVYMFFYSLVGYFTPLSKAVGIHPISFPGSGGLTLDGEFTWPEIKGEKCDLQRGPGIKRSLCLNHLAKPLWNKTPPPIFVCLGAVSSGANFPNEILEMVVRWIFKIAFNFGYVLFHL